MVRTKPRSQEAFDCAKSFLRDVQEGQMGSFCTLTCEVVCEIRRRRKAWIKGADSTFMTALRALGAVRNQKRKNGGRSTYWCFQCEHVQAAEECGTLSEARALTGKATQTVRAKKQSKEKAEEVVKTEEVIDETKTGAEEVINE